MNSQADITLAGAGKAAYNTRLLAAVLVAIGSGVGTVAAVAALAATLFGP